MGVRRESPSSLWSNPLHADMKGPLPVGTEVPGTVRYFEPPPAAASTAAPAHAPTPAPAAGSSAGSTSAPPAATPGAVRVERLGAVAMPGVVAVASEGNPLDPATRACKLGENLYAKERKGKGAGSVAASLGLGPDGAGGGKGDGDGVGDAVEGAGEEGSGGGGAAGGSGGSGAPAVGSAAATAGAAYVAAHGRAALDLLSSLIGVGAGSESKDADAGSGSHFTFSLFGDDGTLAGSGGGAAGDGSSGGWKGSEIITFDRDDRALLAGMMSKLGLDGDGGSAGGGKEAAELTGDDLLAMMDGAT